MGKQIVGVVVGLIVWFVAAVVAGVLLRSLWPEYVAASGDMSFTLPMVTGALLLVMFIPQHISLWDKFPIWYHLTFLTSLVPLAVVGGRTAGLGRRSELSG